MKHKPRDTSPFRRYRTQTQIDVAIERFIISADYAERKRDEQPHESRLYWRYHDIAVKWHNRAAELMP